ncbi:hypothetical protein BDZ90DRAFT_259870 [Jaminaea rosea]|uniref:Uncharacterized protein n=1 Tax=Jaminaea rosea TaxID=1569628 RepID=A0A316UUN7_9BASI|nr:hypothetical protein BDZ90DRAFT_259870 [Jaminaea rosea]PWN28041.1 hypothetical protein BDZ90DRAFT_259870 [Jaminaea rosea]
MSDVGAVAGPSRRSVDPVENSSGRSGSASSSSEAAVEDGEPLDATQDEATDADDGESRIKRHAYPPISLDCKRLLMRLVDDGLLDLKGVAKGGPMSLRTARHLRSLWIAGNHSLAEPRRQGRPRKLSSKALDALRTICQQDKNMPLQDMQDSMHAQGYGTIDKSTLSRTRKHLGLATRSFVRAKKGQPSMSKRVIEKEKRARAKADKAASAQAKTVAAAAVAAAAEQEEAATAAASLGAGVSATSDARAKDPGRRQQHLPDLSTQVFFPAGLVQPPPPNHQRTDGASHLQRAANAAFDAFSATSAPAPNSSQSLPFS